MASPAVIPLTFSATIIFGCISFAILTYSKNKSSIFSTFLPSEYTFSWSQPLSLLPEILNAEHGGEPSNISNSVGIIFAASKKSKPVSDLISCGNIWVSE